MGIEAIIFKLAAGIYYIIIAKKKKKYFNLTISIIIKIYGTYRILEYGKAEKV